MMSSRGFFTVLTAFHGTRASAIDQSMSGRHHGLARALFAGSGICRRRRATARSYACAGLSCYNSSVPVGNRRPARHARLRACPHRLVGSWPPRCCIAATPCVAQGDAGAKSPAAYPAKLKEYTQARRAFEDEASAYWKQISEKRRTRIAKRRSNEPILLEDYVLTQPPVYRGPPRPVDPTATTPQPDPTEPRKPPIPVAADFLKAAAEEFGFVPQRPESEIAFKRAYAKIAAAAGLTRDQIVRIYAFETGGNGTYDVQAGLTHTRPRRARDFAGRRLQPASEHQQHQPARRARRPLCHHAAWKARRN